MQYVTPGIVSANGGSGSILIRGIFDRLFMEKFLVGGVTLTGNPVGLPFQGVIAGVRGGDIFNRYEFIRSLGGVRVRLYCLLKSVTPRVVVRCRDYLVFNDFLGRQDVRVISDDVCGIGQASKFIGVCGGDLLNR